jgi:hypothetical protein
MLGVGDCLITVPGYAHSCRCPGMESILLRPPGMYIRVHPGSRRRPWRLLRRTLSIPGGTALYHIIHKKKNNISRTTGDIH